jgi:hypothetical protein
MGYQGAVVVIPQPPRWSESSPPFNFTLSPFPIVICQPSALLPGEGRSSHPCIRPLRGREDVAILSFSVQNYPHLPPHLIFLHGHETAWHQDQTTSNLLLELCSYQPFSNDTYVALANIIASDFRKPCLLPFQRLCKSFKKQQMLAQAWGLVSNASLNDASHFCCAQFLVSRSHVLRHPLSTYQALLQWAMDNNVVDNVLPGMILEVVWPFLFGEKHPLGSVLRSNTRGKASKNLDGRLLGFEWPSDMYLPSELLVAYRRIFSSWTQ